MTYAQAQTAGVKAGLDDIIAHVHNWKLVPSSGGWNSDHPQHGMRAVIGIQIVAVVIG